MGGEFITRKGLKKLQEELAELKSVRRPQIAARIKEAVSFGDLVENAEYAEAKEAQAFIEGRILEIEGILRNSSLVEPVSARYASTAQIGCRVEISGGGPRRKFTIVGRGEGDPQKGEISSDSPIGRAILGRGMGESVTVSTPKGNKQYKIIKIA